MRKNYPDLSITDSFRKLLSGSGLNKIFLFLGLIMLSLSSYGQQFNVEIPTPFISDNFDGLSVSKNTTRTSGIGVCALCGVANESNLIDGNLTNFASSNFGVVVGLGTTSFENSLRVTDSNTTYDAGTFAGFKMGASGNLLSLELLGGVTIKTYNNNIEQESFTGASLLNLSLLAGSGSDIVGFNTTKQFDAIEVVFSNTVALLSSTNIYHAVIRQYTAGPALACNTVTKMSLPTYPVIINQVNTGVSGISVGSGVSNVENAISSSDTDYATINSTVAVGATASIAIKDQLTDYPAGTYAGFEISNSNLLNVSVLGRLTVSTYLNGTEVETFSGNNLLAGVSLLDSGGRFKVGFVSTQTFDEVKLSIDQSVGVTLGETRVYGAVFQSFCAGPALVCNTPTKMTSPIYPVFIDSAKSGFEGLVSVGSVSNIENVVSANDSDYASINFLVSALGKGSIAVKDQLTDYPAGTYAGFEISNSSLLDVSVLGNIAVTTYLNGTEVETFSGNNLLAGVSLLATNNRFKVGFVASQSFDEVRISINQPVGLNLGETRVYGAVFQSFCAGPALVCNTPTKMTSPIYPVFIDSAKSGFEGLVSVGSVSNIENVVSANDSDYASINFLVSALGKGSIAVKDQLTDYPAGTYAGFEISNSSLLDVSVLGNIAVTTYLNGTEVETFSGNNLLAGVSLLASNNRFKVGFVASQSFDEVRISINQPVGLNLGETRVYGAVFQSFCAGPALVCNTPTKMTSPIYPVFIDSAKSGFEGLVSVGSVSNIENVVSANDSDYASINFLVAAASRGSIAVKDQITNYPVGTYAGFEIENNSLLAVSALGNVTITTYLDGAQTETFSGTNLVANVALLPSAGRFKLGFVSSQAFDEVRLTVNQTVGISLGETRVYGAVFQSFCAGPELVCNTQTPMTAPTYPVYVNNVNSGINGAVCALCEVINQDNLVDADLTNYAQVNIAVGALSTGSLSVKNQINDYPAGTFAGYTLENPALLAVDALNSVIVTTYLNGVQQETKTGNSALVSVGTDLLVGTGKKTIGFVSTKAFDEVQITFQNTVGVNLGIVKVYNAVFQKLCDPVVECNKNYVWSNPAFPVTIDADHTGIQGVTCVGCAVNNTDNLLTASETDFANISLIAGVGASASVAVKDNLFTYPKGTFAGYVIRNLTTLAQVNLLQSLTIRTYNNGVLQESRSASNLIDLSLLGINVLGSTPGVYNVGFRASLPFDEIRLTLNSVASVINSIDVYGAFVNTSESDGGTGSGLECNKSAIAVTKDGTYVDVNSDGIVNVGDRIDYVFDIKNTGFETLTNVTLTDNNATVTGTPIASLAAGANNTTNYTATYAITQADIDAGVVYNLATVNATTNLGAGITATSTDPTPCTSCPPNPSTCPDCTATPLTQIKSIALVKTANVATTRGLGDTITYTFSVTNTGNTTLTNVVVTDPMVGLTIVGSPITSLAPGDTNTSITGTYSITQTDVNAGNVTNTALVTAKDPQGNDVIDTSGTTLTTDDATITPVDQTNTIALVKTASVVGAGGLNDQITYTFAVTNTGTTTLTNVVVTDPMTGLIITGSPIASLAPGVTDMSITGTYIITQTDVNAGNVTNSALVTAKDPQGNNVTDISGTTITTDDPTETPIGFRSTIALVKTANTAATRVFGDTITYTFSITNTGTTTLTNVVVTDPLTGLTISGNPIASLDPGITDNSITGTYVITQADVNAGKVTNSAKVTAKSPQNDDVTDVSGTTIGTNDATVTPVNQTSRIALIKTANTAATRGLGDTITYTFEVINTGTTTLTNVIVSDPMVGLTITGSPIASLAPGETNATVKGSYIITQTNIDAGSVTNTAKVTAKNPQNIDVSDTSGTAVDNDDPTVIVLPKSASIALVKTGVYNGNASKAEVGDVITYTFTVTNTGNVTVKDIVINDTKLGTANLAIVPGTLAPLAQGSITQNYIVTQVDIDAGNVTNTAIAVGQDPQGINVQDTSGTAVDNDDSTVTTLPKSASIALVKVGTYKGDLTKAKVGDKITYTFTVLNRGNVTVSNIVINDTKLGTANLAIVPGTLAPLAAGVVTQDYTITQADIDLGTVTNTAIAIGQDPQGANVQDTSGTAVDNDDSTITTLPKSGSLAFVKTGVYNGDATKAQVGDKITYTFTVTNTGNVTVSNIVINDAKLGATSLALVPSILAPLATGVVTQDYTITQADIDLGSVTNTAIAVGQDPQGVNVQDTSGTAVDNDDSTVTTLPKSGSLAFVKTGVYNGDATKAKVGDKITYTFTVTNTGNVTVSNIVINDAKLGATSLALVPSTLAPLGTGVITQDYTITQADIDLGSVTNTAIAVGQDPQGVDVQDTSGTAVDNDTATETTLPKSGSLAFVKTGVYNGDAAKAKVGDKITYTFTVTNTGNVTVSNILINDAKLGATSLALVPSTLAPLATGVITQDYTITQADIDLGTVTNTAIAIGQDPQGINVQDTSGTAVDNDDSTITTLPKSGSLAFVKTGVYNGDATKAQVGDKITYTFTVTNTGNVTVSNIVINDAKLGATSLALVPSILAPLATGVVTQDYTITQADIDLGSVTNTAIAVGQDPQGVNVQDTSGTAVDNDTATETTLPKSGSLAFVKTGVYNGDAAKAKVGDKITYTFTVTNTGNVTVSNILINDAKLGATSLALVPSTLAPLGTGVITQDYTITQADIDLGSVTNTAIAVGQDPQGVDVQDTSGTAVDNDTATETTLPKSGSLAFVKTGVYNGDAAKAKVGDKITYTFTVTNTGNVTVSNILINDAKLGATSLALVPSTLAPLATGVITQDYTITQADIDLGTVTNTAIAIGQDPQGINVQDTSGTAVDNDDSTITTLPKSGSLAFVKTGVYNGDATKAQVGDKITYTFTVTNTGNVTVSNIVINDAKLGATSLALVPSILAPLATGVVTQDYTITQADIDLGSVTNTAIAVGQDPQGVNVQDTSGTAVDNDDSTVTTLPKSGSLAFVKTGVYNGDATKAKVGDKITYTFTVTNTGNVTVSNIVINDAKLGATSLALVPSTLAPLGTGVITQDYTITQADIDLGSVTNTAIAIGQDPQGVNVQDTSGTAVDNDDSTVTTLPKSGSLAFVKTGVYNGDATKAKVGDKITYTFTVTNTGNVTVSNILINDAKLGATSLALVPSTLAPLATGVITQDYTITQADIDLGTVTNTAIAIGQDPQGINVQDTSGTAVDNDDSTITTLPKSGSLAFVKTGVYNGDATKAKVGDKITYTFKVTNTGNVTVSNIVINDAKLGATSLALVPSTLAPLATGVVTQDYTITQADIDLGTVTNTAIAIGQDPQGVNVQDTSGTAVDNDDSTITTLPKSGSLAFVKTGVYNGDATKAKVGDKITYTFTVTNTGNVTVSNILINDAKLGVTSLALVPSTLAPLATGVITREYTITQADIDLGSVTNTAIAVGQDQQGVNVQDTSGTAVDNDDSTVTTLPKSGSLAFVKTGVYNGDATKAQVGDKITYTFTVTNTGNVTVSNILINDAKLGITSLALVPSTLAPLATGVITREYTVTQADIDIRKVTNTAIAKGQDPQGNNVEDISGTAVDNDDPTITDLPENAKIALILKGEFQDENQDGQAQIGETIKYNYTIMNMGEVPLSDIWIEDEMVGHGMSEGSINLGVGGVDDTTFSSTYTLTQADIIQGNVSNQATVYGTSPLGKIVQDLSHHTSPLEDGFTVIGVDGCQLTIFNAVSPNSGTEYERILYIRGLDCYPDNTVQIFDRWGVKVYEANGYDNNAKAFRGISEGRVTVSQSKGLATGTYFYVINYVDKDGKGLNKSGYLHLIND